MTIPDSGTQMDKVPRKSAKLCQKTKVLEAINVLKKLNEKYHESQVKKQPLLDEATDCPVFLQVTMKKIPGKKMVTRIKVPLPHSLLTDTMEVCLFTGDLDKRNKKAEIEPDVLHYKELLQKQGITKVNEVIPLRQLRTEYKVYETKRQLVSAYDVFLTDKKIAQCLPKLLGKRFYDKRKFPIQINMNSSNLKSQIENALSATVFSVTCRGNNCISQVARLGMDNNQILENVLASVEVLANKIPGEQRNIHGIYIKTPLSRAIPIFISFENPNEVKLQKPDYHEEVELEELSTLPNAEVKVFRSGAIIVKKSRADTGDEENEIESRACIRKSMDAQAVDEDIEEDNVAIKRDSESEDVEENISPSKLKNKRKVRVKKLSQESKDSEELEAFSESAETCLKHETDNEIIKKDSSVKKTKLRSAHGEANIKNEIQEKMSCSKRKRRIDDETKDEVINEGYLEVKSESKSEDVTEEVFSPSKTNLKKKRKSNLRKECQGDKESADLKVSGEALVKYETEVVDIKEKSKTKSGNKRKSNVNHEIECVPTSTWKRKSVKAIEDEDINTSSVDLKKKKTSVEIEDPVHVSKAQPKARNSTNTPGQKRNSRRF